MSLMIEAGSKLNWTALESGCVDRIFFYYGPKILGGLEALKQIMRHHQLPVIVVSADATPAVIGSRASKPKISAPTGAFRGWISRLMTNS